jgi:hypothetical protein
VFLPFSVFHDAQKHPGSIQVGSNTAHQPLDCSQFTAETRKERISARKLAPHATPRPSIRSTRRFWCALYVLCQNQKRRNMEQGSLVPHSQVSQVSQVCSEEAPPPRAPLIPKIQLQSAERRVQFVAVVSTHNPTHILPAVQQRTSPARKQPAKFPSQFVEDKGLTARGGPRSCRRRYPRLTRCRGGSTPVSILQNPPASR